MEKCLIVWEIAGFLFVVIVGTLLHFVFQWTGRNTAAGIISPVNESVWEHEKLIFFPMLFFSIAEYEAVGKAIPNFIAAKSFGLLFGMLLSIAAFYTYTGIFGKNTLWADILIFVLAVAAAYWISWNLMKNDKAQPGLNMAGFLLILTFAAMFVVFTFSPPRIPLFMDPLSKKYGIKAD